MRAVDQRVHAGERVAGDGLAEHEARAAAAHNAVQRAHLVTARLEPPPQRASDQARRPGDRVAHQARASRSASIAMRRALAIAVYVSVFAGSEGSTLASTT